VSGWLAAAIVLMAPESPDADAVAYQIVGNRVFPLTLDASKRDRQFVQRLEGDMGVWIVKFDRGLDSLLRPPRLAWALLVLSTAIGAGCLGLAKLSESANVAPGIE
jgi:hypothetical protein